MIKFNQNLHINYNISEYKLLTIRLLIIVKDQLNNLDYYYFNCIISYSTFIGSIHLCISNIKYPDFRLNQGDNNFEKQNYLAELIPNKFEGFF